MKGMGCEEEGWVYMAYGLYMLWIVWRVKGEII